MNDWHDGRPPHRAKNETVEGWVEHLRQPPPPFFHYLNIARALEELLALRRIVEEQSSEIRRLRRRVDHLETEHQVLLEDHAKKYTTADEWFDATGEVL